MLTCEEKRELLRLARISINSALAGKPPGGKPSVLPGLLRRSGLFVTLRIDRQLRGCIGYIESSRPLFELVHEVAPKAALEDPRFPPLTCEELAAVNVELSVLSPLRRIYSTTEIHIGEHGLLLELGVHRGLLLPQVATQFAWDTEAFLNATARKAGLYPGAWRDPDAKLYIFSAEVIEEEVHDHDDSDTSV